MSGYSHALDYHFQAFQGCDNMNSERFEALIDAIVAIIITIIVLELPVPEVAAGLQYLH